MAEPLGGAGADDEAALRALQERLDRATEAAERLLADAATRRPPPAGWRAADSDPPRSAAGDPEDAARLLGALAGLLEWVPPELQQRLAGALRELLSAVRALIDWCLERLERRRAEPADVQDIPIL